MNSTATPTPRSRPEHQYTRVTAEWPLYEAARDYIYKSWSDSFRDSPWRGMVPRKEYAEDYRPKIERSIDALVRLGGLVLCHHPDLTLAEFYGWAGVEPGVNCLHYGYVTKCYRGHNFLAGCAVYGGLINGLDGITYSWRTKKASELAQKHRWRYRPNYGHALQHM